MFTTTFKNFVIAGPMFYTPKYVKNGRVISAHLRLVVAEPGNPTLRLAAIAWGTKANQLAKRGSLGRKITINATPQSYLGRIYNADGTIMKDSHLVNKLVFIINKFKLGRESRKQIEYEYLCCKRPFNWNNPAHPDYKVWKEILKMREQLKYSGGQQFGFAKVIIHQ